MNEVEESPVFPVDGWNNRYRFHLELITSAVCSTMNKVEESPVFTVDG